MKTLPLLLTLACVLPAHGEALRPIPETEMTSTLLEGRREIISLQEMARLGLNEARTGIDLWSGSYWPHYQGALGVRYRDPHFARLIEKDVQWDKFKELRETLPLYTYAQKENLLSPAEKYDLLVGDREMSLTKYSWEVGEKAAGVSGHVPKWRGICDGFASAAQKMPRPVKTVTMTTPDGLPIAFYPEDIKALGSLLYARGQENVIFLGKRCRSPLLGLFTNACDETNPGTFHRALVNRVGAMKKSFIADVSPGSEVWNYPVHSYKFTYYNVFDEEESQDFTKVMEPFTRKNRFAEHRKRHKRTSYIVGVKAVVKYTNMRPANLLETDGESGDSLLEMTYVYDLELDHSFNVLGGESMSGNLPDFVWAPNDGTYPLSDPEQRARPVSRAEIVKASQEAAKKGQPLAMIVERLFEAAK